MQMNGGKEVKLIEKRGRASPVVVALSCCVSYSVFRV